MKQLPFKITYKLDHPQTDVTQKSLKLPTVLTHVVSLKLAILVLTLSSLSLLVVMGGDRQPEPQQNQHCLDYFQARIGRTYAVETCK